LPQQGGTCDDRRSQDRGAQNRARISLEQEHEDRYWTQKLGVAREQLAEAVKAAGHTTKAVEEYLNGARVR
jgi:hypothetical protein